MKSVPEGGARGDGQRLWARRKSVPTVLNKGRDVGRRIVGTTPEQMSNAGSSDRAGTMRDFAASPLISKITSEAMSSEKAMVRLKSARSQLLDMVPRKQFNTARAGNAFSTAIHWAVWENVKDRPNGRALYRDFKRSRLTASIERASEI